MSTNDDLPPLPEASFGTPQEWKKQVQAYAREAVAADRAKREVRLPPGWKVHMRLDLLRTMEITAPNGYCAVITNVGRNPANVFHMLVYDLLYAAPLPKEQT